MILPLIITLFAEILLIAAAGIRFLVRGFGSLKVGDKIKHASLSKGGQTICIVGLVVAVGIPRMIGVRGVYGVGSLLIYVIIVALGGCILVIGLEFILAAYKEEDEIPWWIRKLSRLLIRQDKKRS